MDGPRTAGHTVRVFLPRRKVQADRSLREEDLSPPGQVFEENTPATQSTNTGEMVPLGDITEAHFDGIFNTNVKGVLFTVQKALPLLKDGSPVILTSSTIGTEGTERFRVYSASKAAVRNFAVPGSGGRGCQGGRFPRLPRTAASSTELSCLSTAALLRSEPNLNHHGP
jgi:hypothetical protein